MNSVLALSGPERYAYFIKRVADTNEVWSLYQDGWAMSGDNTGSALLPVWPASEYAAACALDQWDGYAPKAIPLDELLEVVIPELAENGGALAIFYTPEGRGVVPSLAEFVEHLREELAKYDD
jgi:hypothetical protein